MVIRVLRADDTRSGPVRRWPLQFAMSGFVAETNLAGAALMLLLLLVVSEVVAVALHLVGEVDVDNDDLHGGVAATIAVMIPSIVTSIAGETTIK
jgi:hypothetical protein